MPLYHCTHHELAVGSLIEPGNWGRMLMQIGPAHGCWNREIILEAVRISIFPTKPSRLKSVFACETIEAIRGYRSVQCPQGFIYEVVMADVSAGTHKGDFNAVEPLPGRSQDMWGMAQAYWQYAIKTTITEWPGIECSEIVIPCPMRVVCKVVD